MRFEVKAQDVWIGLFWKRSDLPKMLHIWIGVLPCLPLHVQLRLCKLEGCHRLASVRLMRRGYQLCEPCAAALAELKGENKEAFDGN